MKKTMILVAAILLAATATYAQTEKGSQTLGLNLGFGYNKSSGVDINPNNNNASTATGSKLTNFNIGPVYSYFIADKLDLGATVTYNTYTEDFAPVPDNLSKLSSYNFNALVYLRKYFMYQGKLGVRMGPYLGYSRGSSKLVYSGLSAGADQDNKTDSYNAGAKLELVYFPSKKLGFSANLASLDYSHYKTDSGVRGDLSGDSADFNLISNGLSLSVFYVFGK